MRYTVTGGREVSQIPPDVCDVPTRASALDISTDLLDTVPHLVAQREDFFAHAANRTRALGSLAPSRRIRETPSVRERVSLRTSAELGDPEIKLR